MTVRVAVLQLHVRDDTGAALRLADSILAEAPGHLFGFLIRGTAAQMAGDSGALKRAHAGFRTAWKTEMTANRPEYGHHQARLEQFRQLAER